MSTQSTKKEDEPKTPQVVEALLSKFRKDLGNIKGFLLEGFIAGIADRYKHNPELLSKSLEDVVTEIRIDPKNAIDATVSAIYTPKISKVPKTTKSGQKSKQDVKSLKETESAILEQLYKDGLVQFDANPGVIPILGPHKEKVSAFLQYIQKFKSDLTTSLESSAGLAALVKRDAKRRIVTNILPMITQVGGEPGVVEQRQQEREACITKLMNDKIIIPDAINIFDWKNTGIWVQNYMNVKLSDEGSTTLEHYTSASINKALAAYPLMDDLYKKLEHKLGKTVTADTRAKIEKYLLPSIARYIGKGGEIDKIVDRLAESKSKAELKLFDLDGANKYFKHLRKNEFSISKNSLRVIKYNLYPETDSTKIRDSIFKTIDKTLGEKISEMHKVEIHEQLMPIINTAFENGYPKEEITNCIAMILSEARKNAKGDEFLSTLAWKDIKNNSSRLMEYIGYNGDPKNEPTKKIRDSIFKTIDKTLGEKISEMHKVEIHEQLMPIINTAQMDQCSFKNIQSGILGILLPARKANQEKDKFLSTDTWTGITQNSLRVIQYVEANTFAPANKDDLFFYVTYNIYKILGEISLMDKVEINEKLRSTIRTALGNGHASDKIENEIAAILLQARKANQEKDKFLSTKAWTEIENSPKLNLYKLPSRSRNFGFAQHRPGVNDAIAALAAVMRQNPSDLPVNRSSDQRRAWFGKSNSPPTTSKI